MKSQLQVLDLPVDRIESPLVAVPFFSDQRPLEGPVALLDWRLDGMLTAQLVAGQTRGDAGDRYLVKANHKVTAEWVLFVGCGPCPSSDKSAAESVVAELLATALQAGFSQVALGLPVESRERLVVWQEVLESALKSPDAKRLHCQLAACDPAIYS